LEISSSDCNIVLNPMLRLCGDPLGKIFPDKNKTAVDSESSFRCEMYCEIKSTFLFLLGVNRIDSHVSTKVEKKDEALLPLSIIFVMLGTSINEVYDINTCIWNQSQKSFSTTRCYVHPFQP
jgi:hypothetical protein